MKLKDHAVGRTDLLRFRHDQIKPFPGLNVRDWSLPANLDAVREMADKIENKGGIIAPITVALHKEGNVESVFVTDGETRWRAVGLLITEGRANIDTYLFPAMPEPAGSNNQSRDIDLSLRNSGRQLFALETATLFARMSARGLSETGIAKALGKNPSYVSNMLVLASVDVELHDMIRADKVKPTTVINAWRQHGTAATKIILDAYNAELSAHNAAVEQAEDIATAPDAPFDFTEPLGPVRTRGRQPLPASEKAIRRVETLSKKRVKVSAKGLGLSTNGAAKEPGKPRYGAMLDTSLNALVDIAEHGYGARAMAAAYIAQRSETVATVLDWLTQFQDALREKEESRVSHKVAI
jgi:hypothetical protein